MDPAKSNSSTEIKAERLLRRCHPKSIRIGLLVQTDDKVVIAGTAGFSNGVYSGYNFALARIWP
jgi:hypothetical protein